MRESGLPALGETTQSQSYLLPCPLPKFHCHKSSFYVARPNLSGEGRRERVPWPAEVLAAARDYVNETWQAFIRTQ
ncbi:unnamed protein product [Gulo gulo]|uniref:Uncharacterized protein n=1 Tax=Gulo gulo TaxID=48420 RepID=A0A9X9M970_GULGU|nr:unnamed protein product [Gulo gulo]